MSHPELAANPKPMKVINIAQGGARHRLGQMSCAPQVNGAGVRPLIGAYPGVNATALGRCRLSYGQGEIQSLICRLGMSEFTARMTPELLGYRFQLPGPAPFASAIVLRCFCVRRWASDRLQVWLTAGSHHMTLRMIRRPPGGASQSWLPES